MYHSLPVCLSVCVCVCLCVVESYTREAGVRTLERRIGALCRAVAVKVAEHLRKLDPAAAGTMPDNKEVCTKDQQQEQEASEAVDALNIASATIPPKLPILIDVAAVEDILGVSSY